MSIARGVLSGFLKEGLEQKAARDEMYADMVMEAGQEFRKTAQLFRQDEKDIEKRFNLVSAAHGPNAGLYASYNKLLDTDAGAKLVIDQLGKNPKLKKQIDEFDFQGYNFNTSKTQRFMNFKNQQKDTIDLISKNQGSKPVAELFFKDMKTMDTGTQVTRPELDLPALSTQQKDMSKFSSYSFDDQIKAEREARQLFFGTERRPTSNSFKRSYTQGYDAKNPAHGPSKEMYGFRKFFENEFLRNKGITYNLESPFTKKTVTGQTTNQNLTQDQRVAFAQDMINKARAAGNDEAVEAIKNQLRIDLGVTNLSELIK
tara:strand:+ start:140 stop:1084 length:945 start_codon:yes stop_codon:yes gene_type:complete